jgi:hypothetical protein
MNTRQFSRWLLMAAMFVSSLLWSGCVEEEELRLLAAATVNAPDSLVGGRYTFTDAGGTFTVTFLSNNRYELTRTGRPLETGFFTATRSGSDRWNVVTTTLQNGVVTTQYALTFTSPTGGTGTATVADEPRRTFTFTEGSGNGSTTDGTTGVTNGSTTTGPTNVVRLAPLRLTTLNITNEVSQTGPSWYTINFSTNGQFTIELPGYGSGTYLYTPSTNTAQLTLTYGEDLMGDLDELTLDFKAPSGSPNPGLQSGTQRISGQSYPVAGTFTYTGVPQ